jgi:hypothetical protein
VVADGGKGPFVSIPAKRTSLTFLCKHLDQDVADNFKRTDPRSVIVDHACHQKLTWPVLVDDGTYLLLTVEGEPVAEHDNACLTCAKPPFVVELNAQA